MTMDYIETLHALLTNYIESQTTFHYILGLSFLIVVITLYMQVMRSDINSRSTEEDELTGKYILITSFTTRQPNYITFSINY